MKGKEASYLNMVYREIARKAEKYLDTRHNKLHTDICLQFALRLLRKEGGNPTIVVPAIILHDVGWKAVPEDSQIRGFGPNMSDPDIQRIHEVEGSKIARNILEELRYDEDKISKICEIVLFHDSRKEGMYLEDSIVKDADKLWRLSHVSMRIDPARYNMAISNYLDFLQKQIETWYLTSGGKKIARQELLQRWFEFGIGVL
jgi:HD superfamily phosphodiesterase